MLDVLYMSLEWLPAVLTIPVAALIGALVLMAVVKVVQAILAVIGAIISIILPWK